MVLDTKGVMDPHFEPREGEIAADFAPRPAYICHATAPTER